MRVAVLSYPMLFQVTGGLQVQILESIAALRELGIDARLMDPFRERLESFDLVHVFAANNGNHRIIEAATRKHIPTVCSPLIRPQWTRRLVDRARFAERVVGRLTRWETRTEFASISAGLRASNHLVALGEIERACLSEGFGIDRSMISVIPNGIAPRFFEATPRVFKDAYGISCPFILCSGTISSHKNQLTLARAAQSIRVPLVLIGAPAPDEAAYLEQVCGVPGVEYLGGLGHDDMRLASAYAAASVFALVSHSEVMPLSVLESLAAGVPAIVTKAHSMDVSRMRPNILEVDPMDVEEIASALTRCIGTPRAADQCRRSVQHLTWPAVARDLVTVYRTVLEAPQNAGLSGQPLSPG